MINYDLKKGGAIAHIVLSFLLIINKYIKW